MKKINLLIKNLLAFHKKNSDSIMSYISQQWSGGAVCENKLSSIFTKSASSKNNYNHGSICGVISVSACAKVMPDFGYILYSNEHNVIKKYFRKTIPIIV